MKKIWHVKGRYGSDTLEWYQTLLRCHNFVSIPKYYYKRGKGKLETEQTRLDNFKEAWGDKHIYKEIDPNDDNF